MVQDESIVTWNEIKNLRDQGAVGEFALHFYDSYGKLVDSNIENRIIGIEWNELKEINPVVAIAGGTDKIDAILGALRGGICQCSNYRPSNSK